MSFQSNCGLSPKGTGDDNDVVPQGFVMFSDRYIPVCRINESLSFHRQEEFQQETKPVFGVSSLCRRNLVHFTLMKRGYLLLLVMNGLWSPLWIDSLFFISLLQKVIPREGDHRCCLTPGMVAKKWELSSTLSLAL